MGIVFPEQTYSHALQLADCPNLNNKQEDLGVKVPPLRNTLLRPGKTRMIATLELQITEHCTNVEPE